MATNNSADNPTGAVGTVLQGKGIGTASFYSSATYPSSTTANQILFSSATNTIGGISTANSGVLTTNGSGVPSITSTILPQNGGGLVLIATNNPVAALTSNFTNVTGFTTFYFTLQLGEGTTNGQLAIKFSSNNGVSYSATGYASGVNYSATTTGTLTNINSTAQVLLSDTSSASGNAVVYVSGYIYPNGAGSTQYHGFTTFLNSGATAWQFGTFGGTWTGTANALQFLNNGASGTISGKVSVYGVSQ
jgi:hypothetical protein